MTWVVLYHDKRQPSLIEEDRRALELAEARERGDFIEFEGSKMDSRVIKEILTKEKYEHRYGDINPNSHKNRSYFAGLHFNAERYAYAHLFRAVVAMGLKYKSNPNDKSIAKKLTEAIGKLKPPHQALIYGHGKNKNTPEEHVLV